MYVIILGDIPIDVPPPNQNIGGDVSPASPAGLTPVTLSEITPRCLSLCFGLSVCPSVRPSVRNTELILWVQITRRYAEFSAAIIGLNESFASERVNQLMSQLLNEVENFILRMAAEFPQRREQLVFLINNYDMMLAVIVVSIYTVSQKSMWRYLFEHNSNINCSGAVQNRWGGKMKRLFNSLSSQ